MPGGKHAVNKAYTYKPRLSRAHKKRVVAAKTATSGGIVKRKSSTSGVIPSNIEKSNKKRANRGLARAIEKLKESGAFNKATKSGAVAGSSAGKKAVAKDVDGDVEMKEAEHEIIVTKKAKAPKKATAAAAVADDDSMDVDAEPAAKPAVRRSTRRSLKK
ncbi:hypothetical protein BCR44DRAFT_63240 [Catenaria anguillulae PL171]|uniref:Uncharacterized protein n=1 Tax=Catenaria anguillulae PL171 TaxID=765915 RepID=A0A1Y2HXN5_9FUNG|nr:hypothetical protein BCR44DRAFT_63240 [Catenaria anguillulae PL171]